MTKELEAQSRLIRAMFEGLAPLQKDEDHVIKPMVMMRNPNCAGVLMGLPEDKEQRWDYFHGVATDMIRELGVPSMIFVAYEGFVNETKEEVLILAGVGRTLKAECVVWTIDRSEPIPKLIDETYGTDGEGLIVHALTTALAKAFETVN